MELRYGVPRMLFLQFPERSISTTMRTAIVCLLMAFFAVAGPAADLTGKWTGTAGLKSPDGQEFMQPVVANFKQIGADVTGTAGYNENDILPIEKGKIEENKFTFRVVAPDTEYYIDLKIVSENRLEGTVKFTPPGGSEMEAKLLLNKAQ
jgi:hypothetical protein